MIDLKNIHVTYNADTVRAYKALRGITLHIKEGEFVTVIGSNGAGKSTLLNILSGGCVPSKGQVVLDGRNVSDWSPERRAPFVARVFQDPLAGTCADLTLAENLALAVGRGAYPSLRRAVTPALMQEFKNALKALKLEDRLDMLVSSLSGGQRQALSLTMATLSPLKILLLDEHTSALDPKTADFVMQLTHKRIVEKNLTTVMVTHSLQQALQWGNRTIMLHEGKIICDMSGQERKQTSVADLLNKFGVDDDRLLLNH